MYLADTSVLSKGHHPDFYDYMERMSVLAKRLCNAALFRPPPVYTGWEREARTANPKGRLRGDPRHTGKVSACKGQPRPVPCGHWT